MDLNLIPLHIERKNIDEYQAVFEDFKQTHD